MVTLDLYAEWTAIIARRRRFSASGQDGCDFANFLRWRGISAGQHQLELFS